MVDVTVTTASIPGREHLLVEAIASVNAQTAKPTSHLIRVQAPPDGAFGAGHLAGQRNVLLDLVDTRWLAILDDDDVYLPYHFEVCAEALDSDADVIYTFARVGNVARENVTDWPAARLLERLRAGNCISSNSILRAGTVRAVDGWGECVNGQFPSGVTWDDWDMWIRLAQAGAKFRCVPVETWDYRSGDWGRISR